MLLVRLAACAALVAPLAACGTPRSAPASVKAGECQVFEAPPVVIAGKTDLDQDWIDDTIESGVAGCGWKRPKPRQP